MPSVHAPEVYNSIHYALHMHIYSNAFMCIPVHTHTHTHIHTHIHTHVALELSLSDAVLCDCGTEYLLFSPVPF